MIASIAGGLALLCALYIVACEIEHAAPVVDEEDAGAEDAGVDDAG